MERMGPPIKKCAAHILTPSFQFSGQLEVIGNPWDFLNDSARTTLPLVDARIDAITPSGSISGLSRPQIYVRKQDVVLVYFADPETRAEIRLLARTERIVAYTPVAVLQAEFHLPAEARLTDLDTVMPGDFLGVTSAKLFMTAQLRQPFPESCEQVLLGKAHAGFYHTA